MSTQKLSVLDNVAGVWMRPTSSLLFRASSEVEEALAAATVLECYSWVELGLLAELLPARATEETLTLYFGGTSPAFDAFANQGLWPQEKIEALRAASLGKRPFLSEHANQALRNPAEFRHRVQTAMFSAADFAFDKSAQAFVAALLFADNDRWSRVLDKRPTAKELLQPLSWTPDIWLDGHGFLVYAGLLRTVDQIESLLFTVESAPPRDVSESDDWFTFRRSLVAAQGWKMRPRTLMAQERFKQLLSLVDGALGSFLPATGAETELRGEFSSYAEEILERWIRATEPRIQTA
jgi:hypothetical protein